MPAAAKGVSGLAVEAGQSGLVQLLTPTLVSALPQSLTTPIPGSAVTGMRLVIVAYNHSASGTIGVAGTAVGTGGALTETTTSLPVPETPGEPVFYTTTNVFASINASGITLGSGLTGGTIAIYGVQAAKRMVVGEFKITDKLKEYSPVEQRGVYDNDFFLMGLQNDCSWEYSGDFYPDDNLFVLLGGYNASPTIVSIPASPTSLLAATSAVTSGNASLTAQPTAPGMVVQVTIAGGPATAATVTVTGTNEYGEAYSEVVVPSTKANGTYYSLGRFATVNANGVVWGAFGGAATVAVAGVFGYQVSGLPGDALSTFAGEQYDGEGSYAVPFCLEDEWSVEFGADKETKVTAKGPAQSVLVVGDSTVGTNQITPFAIPQDQPITGWRALVFLDDATGSFGTTLQPDVIDGKIDGKLDWVPKYTAWSNPPYRTWNRAYRKRRKIGLELTLDMTTTTFNAEYQAWKRRKSRLARVWLIGPLLGVSGGTTYYLGAQFDLIVKWVEEPTREYTTSKESVEVKLKGVARYDFAQGFSHRLTWFTRYPTW